MRNRWYEPRTGRFLSEDPIGLEGGINPFVFAGADPVNGRDPLGLEGGNCTWVHSGYYYVRGMEGRNREGQRIWVDPVSIPIMVEECDDDGAHATGRGNSSPSAGSLRSRTPVVPMRSLPSCGPQAASIAVAAVADASLVLLIWAPLVGAGREAAVAVTTRFGAEVLALGEHATLAGASGWAGGLAQGAIRASIVAGRQQSGFQLFQATTRAMGAATVYSSLMLPAERPGFFLTPAAGRAWSACMAQLGYSQ
jgi:hypothetical protein